MPHSVVEIWKAYLLINSAIDVLRRELRVMVLTAGLENAVYKLLKSCYMIVDIEVVDSWDDGML